MTVIVYRSGILAADTGTFAGEACTGHTQKIKRRDDGALVAACGFSAEIEAFERWFLAGAAGDAPKMSESFAALTIGADGSVVKWEESCGPYQIEADYHAIGGGLYFALGALAAGSTAAEAVHATIKHYIYSRGPVQVERAGLAHRLVAVV